MIHDRAKRSIGDGNRRLRRSVRHVRHNLVRIAFLYQTLSEFLVCNDFVLSRSFRCVDLGESFFNDDDKYYEIDLTEVRRMYDVDFVLFLDDNGCVYVLLLLFSISSSINIHMIQISDVRCWWSVGGEGSA